MAIIDRLAALVGLGEQREARRRLSSALEEIPATLVALAAATTPAGRAGKLGALAELHTAVAGLHPRPDSPDVQRHRVSATVYRLLADAEFAAATGFRRHRTGTGLESRVGDMLDRAAATPDLSTRPRLIQEMQAALGPGYAAAAVAALPRTVPPTVPPGLGPGRAGPAAASAPPAAGERHGRSAPVALAKAFDPPGGPPPSPSSPDVAAPAQRHGSRHRASPGTPPGPRR